MFKSTDHYGNSNSIQARKRPTSSHQHYPIMDSRPSPASLSSQQQKSRRRLQAQYETAGQPLQLSSLPRFHPAAYSSSSASSSRTATPSSAGPSPQPLSPRSQLRKSDPKRHLAVYHQALLAQYAARDFVTSPLGSSSQPGTSAYKPPSPKLVPLGSPGAVTPLELEGETDNYLSARSPSGQKDHLNVDSYMALQHETKRREDMSPRRLTAV